MLSNRSIITVKAGKKYSALQVEKLYAQCVAWIPHAEFICITDDPGGLSECIKTVELPKRPEFAGWWSKMYQFGIKHRGNHLYLDIDVQIREPFDPYWQGDMLFAPKDPLAVYQPEKNIQYINSSVLHYPTCKKWIFDHYMENWPRWQKIYRGDQEYLWGEHQQRIEYLGDYTESFKWGFGLKNGFAKKPVVLYHGEDVKSYV